MTFRSATVDDCPLLATMNRQLIQDEGHRNRMTEAELEERMRRWLTADYRAVLYQADSSVVAYALYRVQPEEIYLRQLFVVRERRCQGIGLQAMEILRSQVWPKNKRLTVEVLVANERAVRFWRKAGFSDYSLALEIVPDSESHQTKKIP